MREWEAEEVMEEDEEMERRWKAVSCGGRSPQLPIGDDGELCGPRRHSGGTPVSKQNIHFPVYSPSTKLIHCCWSCLGNESQSAITSWINEKIC